MELKKYRLKEIATIWNGATPSSAHPEYYDGDIVWLTPKDLSDQKSKYIFNGERMISKEGFNSCSTHLLPKGTILMSSRAPIGLLAISGCECCTNQGFKNIIVDSKQCDAEFLFYYLKFNMKRIVGLGSGTTFLEVSKASLENFEIELPSLSRQQRIAHVLSSIDQKIALNRDINRNLEAMARQLYDYWFVQFDFPDENGRPYKSSGGKMVWNEKLKREIPEGWCDGKLIDIASITMGQSPDGSSYNEQGEGVLFYQGSTDFGIRFPSVRQFTTAPTRFAKQGDILMSVRAPVGTTNIANADCCIGRGLAAINSKIGSITHLFHIIQDLKTAFDMRNDAGTTFGSITKDDLYGLLVLIPNPTVVSQYEHLCASIFYRQMIIGNEIDSLEKQRDELLPLLMNGQVSVMPSEVNCDLSHD